MENPVSKQCRPGSDYVASDLGLHCLPMTLFISLPELNQKFVKMYI